MEPDSTIIEKGQDLFDRYSEEINRAAERAVREALLKHKQAGNPIAIERDDKVVIVPADEIEID